MKIKILLFIFIFYLINFTSPSSAKFENNIILKVENEIITNFEIKNKILSVLIMSGQEISQENINKLKKKSVDDLIENKLKKIELSKHDIEFDSTQLNSYLKSISSDNIEGLKNKFKVNNLDYQLFTDEIKTQLSWQKLIYKMYVNKIEIDPNSIDQEIANYINNAADVEEYKISEIEVISDNDFSKEKILFIKNKIEELGFEQTAAKFSVSNSAATKGNLGWLNSKSLSEEISDIIRKLEIKEVSKPIVRENTIIFLKLNDKKITKTKDLNLKNFKTNLINKKKNEMFNLYSQSYISKLKNTSLIEYK